MKSSLILIVAIVVGLLAAVLVNKQVNKAKQDIYEGWQTVPICVAARTLEKGHVIDIDYDIKQMLVPKNIATIPDFVTWSVRERLQGQYVNSLITANKPLDRRFLGKPVDEQTRAPLTPQRGLRLITIKVNEVTGTAGHLRPGDKVDILHTSSKDTVTQMILEDITVKHTGRPQRNNRTRNAAYTSVTLEVSAREAMVLTNAGITGTLTLVKRRGAGGTISAEEAKPIKPGNYREQLY